MTRVKTVRVVCRAVMSTIDGNTPFHPRRFPKAARREDVLHVDGQMHGVGDWFDRGGSRHDPSAPFFKPATTPACVEAFRREFEGCAGNAFGKPEFTLRS